MNRKGTVAFDAETGERYAIAGGKRAWLEVKLPARMWRAVRLFQPEILKSGQTFVAHFNREDAVADEAFGHRYPGASSPRVLRALAWGREGSGVYLDKPFSYDTRHHLFADRGAIRFYFKADTKGTLFRLTNLMVNISKGRLTANEYRSHQPKPGGGKVKRWVAVAEASMDVSVEWHSFRLEWSGVRFALYVDKGAPVKFRLSVPLEIRPMGRGLRIYGFKSRLRPTQIVFGPLEGGVMDELTFEH